MNDPASAWHPDLILMKHLFVLETGGFKFCPFAYTACVSEGASVALQIYQQCSIFWKKNVMSSLLMFFFSEEIRDIKTIDICLFF